MCSIWKMTLRVSCITHAMYHTARFMQMSYKNRKWILSNPCFGQKETVDIWTVQILQSLVQICSKTLNWKNWIIRLKSSWVDQNHWFSQCLVQNWTVTSRSKLGPERIRPLNITGRSDWSWIKYSTIFYNSPQSIHWLSVELTVSCSWRRFSDNKIQYSTTNSILVPTKCIWGKSNTISGWR